MIATLLAASVLTLQGAPLSCAVTGEVITSAKGSFDYNGVRYPMCCGGCSNAFKKDAAKLLTNEKLKGKTLGVSLYDVTTGTKIEPKAAKGSSDHEGVRYYFATVDGKAAFDKDPKKYGTAPKKEALYCAVMGHAIPNYAAAGAYVDQGDTRYYVCCPACLEKMKADTASLAAKIAVHVKEPAASPSPKAKG